MSDERREEQPDPEEKRPQQPPEPPPHGYTAGPGAVEGNGEGEDLDLPAEEAAAPGAASQQRQPQPRPEPQASAPPPPPPPRQQAPPRPPAPQPPQPGPSGSPQGQQYPPPHPGGAYQQPPPRGGWRPPQGAPMGPGGYGPPGGGAPPPRRNRALPLIIGLIIVFVVVSVVFVGIVASTAGRGSGGGFGGFMGERIAILNVEGMIGEGPSFGADTKTLVEQVKSWTGNESIRALVIRINSGGGAVSATQDLYAALMDFKDTGRPIVASFGDTAASGGYYAALPADEIFANEGTLTGSIGVMLSLWDFQGLQSKVGISARSVKSGEFKDIGSGSRDMTEEEKALLDEMVTDVFEQFYESVHAAREERVRELLNPEAPDEVTGEQVREHIRGYADGRIFSGRQAYDYGLVDGLGPLDAAVERAAELAGIDPETRRVRAPVRPRGLFGTMGALANRLDRLAPDSSMSEGIRLEYRVGAF